MKKAKKVAKRGPPIPGGSWPVISAGPGERELLLAVATIASVSIEIRDELRGIREELQRFGATNTQLEAATGRLGQRIGEFIEHQFHSVK